MKTFKTTTGSIWNTEKPIRTSMPISSKYGKGTGILTGRYETHTLSGEIQPMLEVDHDFGTDMIFEQFISQ